MTVKIKIKLLDKSLKVPSYSYPGDVAVDLYSRVNIKIEPKEIEGVPTGIAIELPIGYEAQIRPRSGLAIKNGISLVNSPGTIDTEYRGEIVAIVVNLGKVDFEINKGDRICQMAIREVPIVEFDIVDELSKTSRGAKGFGSSGV
ncbi:MAG: dUTP diphosphatase [Candidatus Hodarchaeales archaeon]|jgi:dUTP pyrophosphatase